MIGLRRTIERFVPRERLPHLLLALGAVGYLLRLLLWAVSQGSNDIRTWYFFSLNIALNGLEETYYQQPLFNHPPLMGLWSELALVASEMGGLPFPLVFKLPSLVAELVIGLVLFQIYQRRGQTLNACAAFAAYGLSLSCIMISGYHGNTDAIYFCLAFLAAVAMERRAPFWSGLLLGAALNVKLIPVLIAIPLASRCRSWRAFGRYVAGASVGAVPFLWALGSFQEHTRAAFIENLFMYRSNLEYWGVELAVRWVQGLTYYWFPAISDGVREFGNLYSAFGGKLLLLGSALLGLWHALASRSLGAGRTLLDSYELCVLGFAMFLLLGSGFGVQYVGCIVAPLVATGLLSSLLVSTTTGVFITAVYLRFVTEWWPVFSDHQPIPASFSPWANLAWLSIAFVAYGILRGAFEQRASCSGRGSGQDGVEVADGGARVRRVPEAVDRHAEGLANGDQDAVVR